MAQSTPLAGIDPGLVAALGDSAAALNTGAESLAKAVSNIGVHHAISARSVTRPFKVKSLPDGLPMGYLSSHVGALRSASIFFCADVWGRLPARKGYCGGLYPDVDIYSHLLGGLLDLSTEATDRTSKLCKLVSPGDILDALELSVRHHVPEDIECF